MRTSGLCLTGIGALLAWAAGCGGSTECGPGTFESDGVCVVESPGGHDDTEDLGDDDPGPEDLGDPGDDDPGMDPGDDPQPGDDADPGPGDPGPGDPGPGEDPAEPGDPAAPAAGCDAAGDCSVLAHDILDAINAARAAAAEGTCAGSAFTWDDGVATVAIGHATAMAAAGQIVVDDPGGTLGDRLDAAGVGFSAVGEVYGRARGTAAEAVEQWMGSENLRAYLVSCEYSLGGVGAVPPAAGGNPFLTATFVQP